MAAGQSTVLSGGSPAVPSPVACAQPSGELALDFGPLPRAQTIEFTDVVRLTSTVGRTADVTLRLSGPAAGDVQRVGFWDDNRGVICTGLQLRVGQTTR